MSRAKFRRQIRFLVADFCFCRPAAMGRLLSVNNTQCAGQTRYKQLVKSNANRWSSPSNYATYNALGEWDAVSSGRLSQDQRSIMSTTFALIGEIQGMSQTVSQHAQS